MAIRIEHGTYNDLPLNYASLDWNRTQGNLIVAMHPNNSGKIIFNYPGYNGDIDGWNNKYITLGQHMQREGLGAVIRCGNDPENIVETLRRTIVFGLENAEEISGTKNPELFIMGTSAGAGVASVLSTEFPISKLLLVAPGANPDYISVRRGLARFGGEVYIVIGENDEVVHPSAGQAFYDAATGASHRELHMIKNCDHQFRGSRNGRILSQAPFYAFCDGPKPPFPVEGAGIWLYD